MMELNLHGQTNDNQFSSTIIISSEATDADILLKSLFYYYAFTIIAAAASVDVKTSSFLSLYHCLATSWKHN